MTEDELRALTKQKLIEYASDNSITINESDTKAKILEDIFKIKLETFTEKVNTANAADIDNPFMWVLNELKVSGYGLEISSKNADGSFQIKLKNGGVLDGTYDVT